MTEFMQLDDVIESAQSGFASGARAVDGVVQLRMNNVTTDGNLDWSSFIRVPATEKEIAKYSLEPGDVLFNATNSPNLVGKTAFFDGHTERVVFSNHFVRLRPDSAQLEARYLARWLTFQWQRKTFENLCTQWVNQATVRQEDLLLLKIPLPPLAEQRRIAALLDRADRLRRTRRFAAKLSETFLQAVFVQMFGDPVGNPKGWQRAKVLDLGEVQTGNTPSRDNSEYYGDHIEWIKSDNIVKAEMYITRSVEMLSEEGLKECRFVEPDSLLVTCIAGSPTSIGNVALTNRKVAFNQQINTITPHKGIDPIFLYGLMLVSKPLVQRSTTLGMKRIITKSKFENLLLIKPPLALQEKFARIVRQFERLRAQQREAERQAEHLFQTLLHRAFSGEG